MLYPIVTGVFTLAGVLLGYRLGCQRVIQRLVQMEDAGEPPPVQSPTQAAKEWRRTHVVERGKRDGG